MATIELPKKDAAAKDVQQALLTTFTSAQERFDDSRLSPILEAINNTTYRLLHKVPSQGSAYHGVEVYRQGSQIAELDILM